MNFCLQYTKNVYQLFKLFKQLTFHRLHEEDMYLFFLNKSEFYQVNKKMASEKKKKAEEEKRIRKQIEEEMKQHQESSQR